MRASVILGNAVGYPQGFGELIINQIVIRYLNGVSAGYAGARGFFKKIPAAP
jgi:hypothetical protein